MTSEEFILCGSKCPVCWGKVEVDFKADKIVHITCPRCSWADLALQVYGEKTLESKHPY